MIKNIYISLIMLFAYTSVSAQFIGKDALSKSIFYFQKTNLDSAKKYIDLCEKDTSLNTKLETFYYKGAIYKSIYKQSEKQNKTSPSRLISIRAYKNIIKATNNRFTANAKSSVKYLANTLYNDAARFLQKNSFNEAITNFNLYKNTYKALSPTTSTKDKEISFYLAMATQKGSNNANPEDIASTYLKVIALDSLNPSANFNLATIYYNQGADIINEMDYDMDLLEMYAIQDKCAALFLISLPYMENSYKKGYKIKETLLGLSNIYYALNNLEKSKKYKKELTLLSD